MAFQDPQSVTVSTAPVSLARTGLSLTEGSFLSADGNTGLQVRHSAAKRVRHTVKLQMSKIVADPLVPSQNIPVSYSAHVVVDLPRQGVTADEAVALGSALADWLTTTNLTKLVGSES